jgi:hypothetical protein
MRKVAILLAAMLAFGGCSSEPTSGPAAKPKETKLEKAFNDCDPKSGQVELADGNRSILIHGTGDETEQVSAYVDMLCLTTELNTPEYITEAMGNTTAMMGRQHEESDGISYEWSYHPDNGMDMTMHEG